MGATKSLPRKLRLIKAANRKNAPLWANMKKFGLKRMRTRRLRISRRNWRDSAQLQK